MYYPDTVYDRTRLELLPFEDTEFINLMSYVPNYYTSPNETTLYGSFLQAFAQELGRLEYKVNYSLVANDPQYLTPSDVKRVYEDISKINKEYPGSKQYDTDYRDLVLKVTAAYGLGACSKSIVNVINAYTKYPTTVTELFSDPEYDMSYKNGIKIDVMTPSKDLASSIQIVTNDLVNSIMLAKPAHVGISLSTVFSEGPDAVMDEDMYYTLLPVPPGYPPTSTHIQDDLTITLYIPEADQVENEFIVAPFKVKEMESLLAGSGGGQGLINPRENTVWEITGDSLQGMDLD
jgi:hypothetical protein